MEKQMPFGLGVTLYSFNLEYYTYRKNFEELVEMVTALGDGQGIELVAPQMNRSYPHLSPEFEHRFKNAQQKYGFIPSCYSGYYDPQIMTNRYLNEDEQLEYLKTQIDAAATLGFPVARFQYDLKLMEAILPYLEKKKVQMCCEIHAPRMIERETELLEMLRRLDTPYLGIIPDCGAFCRAPSEVYHARFAMQGVPAEIRETIDRMWKAGAGREEIGEEVTRMGGDELARLMAFESGEYFGHSDPHVMVEVMKYIPHLHGKFFHVNERGEESAVRVPEVVSALVEGGFRGFISCEYEGHHWFADEDAYEQVKRYQALIRRCCQGG